MSVFLKLLFYTILFFAIFSNAFRREIKPSVYQIINDKNNNPKPSNREINPNFFKTINDRNKGTSNKDTSKYFRKFRPEVEKINNRKKIVSPVR